MTTTRPETRALALLLAGRTIAETADITSLPASAIRNLIKAQRGWLVDEHGRVYDPTQPGYRPKAPDGFDPAAIPLGGTKPVPAVAAPSAMPVEHARALALLCDNKTAQEAAEQTGLQLGRVVQLARRQGWTIHHDTAIAIDPHEPDKRPRVPDDVAAVLATAPTVPEPPASPAVPEAKPVREEPPAPAVNSVDRLLAEARACDDRHVQAALQKVDAAITKLSDAYREAADRLAAEREAEAARQTALAEVTELERKLAEARARAKQLGVKLPRGKQATASLAAPAAGAVPSRPVDTMGRNPASWAPGREPAAPPARRYSPGVDYDPKQVREWAAGAGLAYPKTGRFLPGALVQEYLDAHAGEGQA